MKLQQLVEPKFRNSLGKALKATISGTASWKLAKLTKQLEQELTDYNGTREELLKKFADKDDAGEPILTEGVYQLSADALKTYAEEHDALLKQDIEVKTSIKISELGDLGKIEFSAEDFMNLDQIIVE